MKEQHEENVKTLANLDAVLRQKVSQDRAEFEKLEQLEKQFREHQHLLLTLTSALREDHR